MANISLKRLFEAEDFKARSKETGKLVHFKSKDSYQAAIKAGSHEDPKAGKGKTAKASTKPNDMFGGDYAKDRGGKTSTSNVTHVPVQPDSQEVKTISKFTSTREKFIADFINKHKLDASALSKFIEKGSLRDRMDVGTAMVGNPGNKYEKDLIKKFGTSKSEPTSTKSTTSSNMGVDKVVYNTRTKTVGIVRMADERGETKTDADGNVNTSELEPYNPMKYPHQKDAKVAPSTKKEVESRGLWNPFSQDEPTSKPKEARKGNPSVNKEAKKNAEDFGITPQKLGNDGYKKVMLQSAVEALTDANFHDEARELISKIEGKPEWAKRVDYPKMDDPKFQEKMADIRKNGVDSSEYWDGDDNAHEFGRKVASASGWNGVEAADGIAFTLRMNGFHKQADMIQSVFDNKPYMRENTIIKKTNENKMKNISLKALLEADDFKARSKETGKLVHFKSKDSYDAAIKAGSHEDPKADKGGEPKAAAKPNDMFGGDYAKDRGVASKAEKSKYDNTEYWKDDEYSNTQGYIDSDDDDYGDDGDSWGEGPQLTSDRLGKIEDALEDELKLNDNGFSTSRESGGGGGGFEGPMTIYNKNAEYDEDTWISLSVGSPNNDGKFSIVFADAAGMPYFEPEYDALTGDNDLEPQQAYKLTKALMKMPEVQKVLKGEMSKEEFQPTYDKLKAKFSKGKTESTKLTSMIKK
jgi:hypothetical protein